LPISANPGLRQTKLQHPMAATKKIWGVTLGLVLISCEILIANASVSYLHTSKHTLSAKTPLDGSSGTESAVVGTLRSGSLIKMK
jgi:hypothetical protein